MKVLPTAVAALVNRNMSPDLQEDRRMETTRQLATFHTPFKLANGPADPAVDANYSEIIAKNKCHSSAFDVWKD